MIERTSGELHQNGRKVYDVQLRLTVKEMMVDERSGAVARAVARCELTTPGVADASYTLRYLFDGRWEESQVRIQGGMLLAG